jgi:cysteinyl-tRNA synthetase
MSVGEAETYRPYWQTAWEDAPPAWLAAKNEDWVGSYKVKYWTREWRALLYGSQSAYLDQILAAGFDGAFLDVVDAYDYFSAASAE